MRDTFEIFACVQIGYYPLQYYLLENLNRILLAPATRTLRTDTRFFHPRRCINQTCQRGQTERITGAPSSCFAARTPPDLLRCDLAIVLHARQGNFEESMAAAHNDHTSAPRLLPHGPPTLCPGAICLASFYDLPQMPDVVELLENGQMEPTSWSVLEANRQGHPGGDCNLSLVPFRNGCQGVSGQVRMDGVTRRVILGIHRRSLTCSTSKSYTAALH